MKLIQKITAFFLSGLMLMALSACGTAAPETATPPITAVVDDAKYVMSVPEGGNPLSGGGTIAYACDSDGISTKANMAVWRGVQAFAGTFQYEATVSVAKASTDEATLAALRQASESGAALVVCNGNKMASAVYRLQNNYPTVSYLLLDGEPHSEDYSNYTSANNVHCVLFAEEQAGYLAGYVAVQEGNRALGFLGSEQLPGIVRYCTGFMQGAQAAAEQEGVEISLITWYCATDTASPEITAKLEGWYEENVDLVLVSGGNLIESCIAAADGTNGRIIATDWDCTALSTRIKTSAIKCYSRVAQQQLYTFFANGGQWSAQLAGQTETVGLTQQAVALTTADWRVRNFTVEEYNAFYDDISKNALRVGRYSDMSTLPDMPSVAVYREN